MTATKLSKEEILHIAALCNLQLSADDITRLSEILGDSIDYIDVLRELDTKSVQETYQVTGLTNIYQEDDDVQTTLSQEEALQNASERIKNLFGTKAVFDR